VLRLSLTMCYSDVATARQFSTHVPAISGAMETNAKQKKQRDSTAPEPSSVQATIVCWTVLD